MAIMAVSVFTRTYTKAFIVKNMGHEDYVAIVALLGFLVWGAIYIYLASAGFTRDLWNIRAMDLPRLLYLVNVINVLYGPIMLCAKYSIIIQLNRIFCPPGIRGPVWWALYALMAATATYYASCFFMFLFQCVPREKIWDSTVEGACLNKTAAVLSAGIINLVLDFGLLLTPIWAIGHLKMPLRRRLGAISIFAVGFISCGMAAGGVAYRVPLMTDPNMTNAIAKVGLWTFAEYAGTIVVGCMPTMPRFYEAKLRPGLSHIARSSLRAHTSSARSRASQSGSTNSRGLIASIPKSMNKAVISSAASDSELGHDDIELLGPSTRSTTSHDAYKTSTEAHAQENVL